ncbi:MAG: hypothetical protein ACRET4_01755 [Steroidobacteraceae bacterium]
MNRIRFRLIPLLTVLAVLPAALNAKPADVALDACAKRIVTDFAARQGHKPRYTVVLDESQLGSSAESAAVYRFTLIARNPLNGAVVARAQCDVRWSGKVIAFRTLPLTEKPPTVAQNQ